MIKIISSITQNKKPVWYKLVESLNISDRDWTLKLHGLLSVCTHSGLDLVSWITIAYQSQFPRYRFRVNHFRIKVLSYLPRERNLRGASIHLHNLFYHMYTTLIPPHWTFVCPSRPPQITPGHFSFPPDESTHPTPTAISEASIARPSSFFIGNL